MPSLVGENSKSTMDGWFKEAYAKNAIKLAPEAAWLVKNIPFKAAETGLGNRYHQPVVLSFEHGVTYASADSGAFTLKAAVASVMKDAVVEGSQLLLRSRMDYEAASRASKSERSFGDATEMLVENMLESIAKRLEIMFLYGRTGIGALNANSATAVIVISAPTWAPAIWAGMEGCKVDIFPATFASSRTLANAVVSVDHTTRTVTLTSAIVGGLTGDLVCFEGAVIPNATPALVVYNEALGLDAVMNIGAGTSLYGINPQTYNLHKPTVATATGALTVTKILAALLPAIGKGLMGDVEMLVSPAGFQSLVNPTIDPVATSNNRRVDASFNAKTQEYGSENVVIRGNQGKITITPHLFVKNGDAFLFPKKSLKRVGSTDVTFNTPGRGDEFFLQIPDVAGFELRCYANQSLFVETPGRCVKMEGIT